MTAKERFEAMVHAILKRHEKEIEAAPQHFGVIIQNDEGDFNDGVEYEPRNPVPEWLRDDLKGWLPLDKPNP